MHRHINCSRQGEKGALGSNLRLPRWQHFRIVQIEPGSVIVAVQIRELEQASPSAGCTGLSTPSVSHRLRTRGGIDTVYCCKRRKSEVDGRGFDAIDANSVSATRSSRPARQGTMTGSL